MSEPSSAYRRRVRAISAVLYEVDPDGRGSSVLAPEDEYDGAAGRLLSLIGATQEPTAINSGVQNLFPAAPDTLAGDIAAALAELDQHGRSPKSSPRERAADVIVEIRRLFEQTSTTDYVREIDGILGLLGDPGLDDAEALDRALGAFSRMRDQMATSRDEFYLAHPDREQRRKYNTWLAASMERLEAHLRAEA